MEAGSLCLQEQPSIQVLTLSSSGQMPSHAARLPIGAMSMNRSSARQALTRKLMCDVGSGAAWIPPMSSTAQHPDLRNSQNWQHIHGLLR